MAKNSEKTEPAAANEDIEAPQAEPAEDVTDPESELAEDVAAQEVGPAEVSEADQAEGTRSETVAAPALSLEVEVAPTVQALHRDFVVNLRAMLAEMTTLPHMADAGRRKTMAAADVLIERLEEDLV